MSLKEINALSQMRRAGGMTRTRSIEVLASQLDRLEAKATELAAMRTYLRAKIDWLSGGEIGAPPDLGS